jgi:hypothetical protein
MLPSAKASSLFRRIATSASLGLAIAMMGVLAAYFFEGSSPFSVTSIDDIVVGIITGVVVFAYEQRQHRAALRKISMIAAMNHHVRNALQSISYAPYTEQTKQIQLIKDSVQRIQWALSEILPGEMEESQLQENMAGPPSQSP